MGLDDLVDQKEEKSKTSPSSKDPGSNKDWKAEGEDDYFNNKTRKRNGIIDNLREEIEVDGQIKQGHTLYVAVTPLIKIEGGVAFRKDKTKIVDLNGKDFTIRQKELKVKYDDKSQISTCYEIRVR